MYQDKRQFDLRDYWAILFKWKSLLIFPMIIAAMVAVTFSFFMAPTYVSSVTILLGESKVLPPTVEQRLEGDIRSYNMISLSERRTSLYNQITSTKYLRRLITALDIPITETARIYAQHTKSTYPEISESELAETILADELRQNINVSLISEELMQIRFGGEDPITAQKRCKALAETYIEESLAQELAGIKQNIVFSEEQLNYFRGKLKNAENNLRNYRNSLIVSGVENDTSEYDFRYIMSAINALDVELSLQDAKQIDIRSRLMAANVDIANLSLSIELLVEKERIITAVSTLADLLSKYTWRDPRVLSLNEETRELLNALARNIVNKIDQQYSDRNRNVRKNISDYLIGQNAVDFNQAKRTALDRSIFEIKSRMSRNPDSQIRLDRLQGEIDHYKNLYELFASHAQYAVIDQSAKKTEAEAKFNIVEAASLPLKPESPNKRKLLLMGLGLGLLLGGGAILLLEILDSSFKRIDDVESYLKLKVIGTIPKVNLPFNSKLMKKLPEVIGIAVSLILAALIIYLQFFKD